MDDHSNPDLGRAMVSKKHWACKHAGLLETASQVLWRSKTSLQAPAIGENEPNCAQLNPTRAERASSSDQGLDAEFKDPQSNPHHKTLTLM